MASRVGGAWAPGGTRVRARRWSHRGNARPPAARSLVKEDEEEEDEAGGPRDEVREAAGGRSVAGLAHHGVPH